MKKIFFLFAYLCSTFIFFSACSGGQQENKKDELANDSVKTDTSKKAVYKVYSLPAPMQIPTAIRNMSEKFNVEYLNPSDKQAPGNADNSKQAMLLGLYGVDMGYCQAYSQNQAVMNYMSKIARISEALNITGAFDPSVVKRMKSNISHPDSASYILLSSFNNARSFLKMNKREEMGYLIAAGSFIEGLHMTTAIANGGKSKNAMELLGQQKIFLENLVELMQAYTSNEGIKKIFDNLSDLKVDYDKVIVETEPGDQPGVTKVKSVSITPEQLSSITRKTDDMRKTILE